MKILSGMSLLIEEFFRHLKLEPHNVEERTLKVGDILPNALERYKAVGSAYDKLSQTLRMMQDLPLLITNIHPVSPYLRRTAVPFPFVLYLYDNIPAFSQNCVLHRKNLKKHINR